ncbi:MAG: DUF4350 domain-containing protein [Verrucomicrobiota bacterium]|jgi:hypothetical protein
MSNETAPSFTPGRKWAAGFHVVISTLALLAIMAMVNYLSSQHYRRLQVSDQNRHELSPMTLRLLGSLTNAVKVIVFFDRREPLYSSVSELLEQYRAACPRLQIEFVDYRLSPGKAEYIQDQYKLEPASLGSRIVFHAHNKTRVVYEKELSQLDYSEFLAKREARRVAFRGEMLFTSAIYGLIDPKQPKAFFLLGHDEHDTTAEDDFGYARFARMLQGNNIAVQRTALLEDVPPDSLLIIAGPGRAFREEELERIERFLKQGGRLFALFNFPNRDTRTGLEKLLSDWGVDVGHNYVQDRLQGRSGETQELLANSFGEHAVVQPLLRSRVSFILPRSIGKKPGLAQGADAPKVTELIYSSGDSMVLVTVDKNKATPDRSRTPPVPLAAAVEKGTIQGVTADRGTTRLVVVGDSYFLTNAYLQNDANHAFASLTVNWLLNRDVLMEGIGPQPIKEYKITLTESQMRTLSWLLLAALPGGVLFLGFLVWLRRRS